MADISKCSGGRCPRKNQCYRFRAIPHEYRQSYIQNPYETKGFCDMFWSIEGYKGLTPLPQEEEKNVERPDPEPTFPNSPTPKPFKRKYGKKHQ